MSMGSPLHIEDDEEAWTSAAHIPTPLPTWTLGRLGEEDLVLEESSLLVLIPS